VKDVDEIAANALGIAFILIIWLTVWEVLP